MMKLILRLLKLKMLEVRGLVIRETLPDGSAILHFPQPDYPEGQTKAHPSRSTM